MNNKSKKVIIFTGLAAVCVGLFSVILAHANADAKPEDSSSKVSSEIIMATPNSIVVSKADSKSGTSSAFVPSSGTTTSAPLTTVSKPTSMPPKPTPPASSELTNPSSKPQYTSKPAPKANIDANSKKVSSAAPKKDSSTAKKTDNHTNNGDPVFGNDVITEKGGNQQTIVGKPGDELTGDKVGIMD